MANAIKHVRMGAWCQKTMINCNNQPEQCAGGNKTNNMQ